MTHATTIANPATCTVRVESKIAEATDICAFELVDPEGRALPRCSAGSHVDVQLPNSAAGRRHRRDAILCLAERLANAGASFEMHHCTGSADRTAFATRIRGSAYAGRVRTYHDDAPAEQRFDQRRVRS